jgi:hypothetical protein
MPKKTLVVTRRLTEEVESRISRAYVARFNADERLSDELMNMSAGADALLITQQDVTDAQVLSRLPSSVRAIARRMQKEPR